LLGEIACSRIDLYTDYLARSTLATVVEESSVSATDLHKPSWGFIVEAQNLIPNRYPVFEIIHRAFLDRRKAEHLHLSVVPVPIARIEVLKFLFGIKLLKHLSATVAAGLVERVH
jgi:hypothetical protein